MTGGGFRGAATRVGRGKDKRASFWQDFSKKWMIRDADTYSIVMVVIKMMKIRVFRKDKSKLARKIFLN